jgi:hypothetical protein
LFSKQDEKGQTMKTSAIAWTVFLALIVVGAVLWLALGLAADRADTGTMHGRFLGPHVIRTVQ